MKGEDVVCVIKNSATLSGSLFTLHVSQIPIDLPTLTDKDKDVWATLPPSYFLLTLFFLFFIFYFFIISAFCDIYCSYQVISTWGVKNKIDFLSLSYTRHAEDVRQVSNFSFMWLPFTLAF